MRQRVQRSAGNHVSADAPTPSRRSRRSRLLLNAYLLSLVFLMPIKLGSVIGVSEVAMFPLSGWEWVFGTWPSFLFPSFAGVALLGATLLYPATRTPMRSWIVPVTWLLLLLSALPGLIRTTEWDTALLFLWHILGVICLVGAVFWILPHQKRLPAWILSALAAGTLFCCVSGWRQKFGGLQATLEFAEQQAKEHGLPPPLDLRSRVNQGRVFGPFVYPNSFAAHLLLTGPLLLLMLWRWAGRFEPVRASRCLFVTGGAILLLGALWMTGSRAGFVALVGGLGAGALCLPGFRRWRLPLVLAAVLVGIVAFHFASRGRSRWSSLSARGHYYSAALRMTAQQPLTGVGLGEFFPYYMRLKPPRTEEARLPHCMVLNLSSQAGIFGGLAAALCLTVPLVMLLLSMQQARTTAEQATIWCVLVGLLSWGAHSLVDFNVQIPGTIGIAALLPLLCRPADQAAALPGTALGGALRAAGALLAGLSIGSIWRVPGEHAYQTMSLRAASAHCSLLHLEQHAAAVSRRLPWSPYPWMLLGRTAEASNRPALALKAYGEAAHRSPHRAAIFVHLAGNHLALGNRVEARQALAQAEQWYPHNSRLAEFREHPFFEQRGAPRTP